MSTGLKASKRIERRRRRRKIWSWLFIIVCILAAGAYAYETGSRLARSEVKTLENRVTDLSGQVDSLQAEIAEARGAAAANAEEAREWQARYQAEVPTGASKALFDEMQALMEEGVQPDRIRLLMEAARKAQECSGEVESKRFGVASPLSEDPNQPVNMGGNVFLLRAEGQSATDAAGDEMSWFDPGKPVTVHFIEPGGETTTVTDTLPIFESIARGGEEYRFSITDAEVRGYLRASVEVCSL